jgi:hypothetical protein
MTGWLDLNPVGGWEPAKQTRNRVTFEHSKTENTLIAFRLVGPYGRLGETHEDYVLRHLHEDRESWRDFGTFEEPWALEKRTKEVMQHLPE